MKWKQSMGAGTSCRWGKKSNYVLVHRGIKLAQVFHPTINFIMKAYSLFHHRRTHVSPLLPRGLAPYPPESLAYLIAGPLLLPDPQRKAPPLPSSSQTSVSPAHIQAWRAQRISFSYDANYLAKLSHHHSNISFCEPPQFAISRAAPDPPRIRSEDDVKLFIDLYPLDWVNGILRRQLVDDTGYKFIQWAFLELHSHAHPDAILCEGIVNTIEQHIPQSMKMLKGL